MEIPLLTSGESKVYKALVELGESSVGNILKFSGVSHSKIYDILKRLSKKGLVSSINKNGRKYFSSSDPSRLNALVEDKEEKLEETKVEMKGIVSQLNLVQNTSKSTPILSSYEGFKGMKTVLDEIITKLKRGDEVLILGAPKEIGERAGGYLKQWQKDRIKKGAVCKIITDVDSTSWDDSWWKKSKKEKKTFTKRTSAVSPAYFVITKDSVVTIYFSNVILSLIVDHSEISQRYKEFFGLLWSS
jgi:HTH-type transcriptional regulator, sugar sensing transcriptional regulator